MQGTANPRTSVQFRPEPPHPARRRAAGHNPRMQRKEIRDLADPVLVDRLSAQLCERGSFAGIAVPVMARVVRAGAMLELDQGELLVREGDAPTPEVFVLIEGTLAVQSKGRLIARLDQPGAVIGEVAVVLSARRTADVVAESAVRALAVPVHLLAEPEFVDVAAGVRGAMLRDDWVKY